MDHAQINYERYLGIRKKLAMVMDKTAQELAGLALPDDQAVVIKLKDGLMADVFRVMAAGRFNAGKSTFINALLHSDILPVKALPTTAVITEISYGLEAKAWLFFNDPVAAHENLTLPEKAMVAGRGTEFGCGGGEES